MTRIGLGVEINNQGSPPFTGADRCQIADDRGLADAALLVEDHPPHKPIQNNCVTEWRKGV